VVAAEVVGEAGESSLDFLGKVWFNGGNEKFLIFLTFLIRGSYDGVDINEFFLFFLWKKADAIAFFGIFS